MITSWNHLNVLKICPKTFNHKIPGSQQLFIWVNIKLSLCNNDPLTVVRILFLYLVVLFGN